MVRPLSPVLRSPLMGRGAVPNCRAQVRAKNDGKKLDAGNRQRYRPTPDELHLDDDRLLTFEEAVVYLNVSESTLGRMIANREITAIRIGGRPGRSHSHPSIGTAGGHAGMAKQIAPAFPFAPDEIVEALETWAGSGNVLVKQGTRLRASHELVVQGRVSVRSLA